MRSTLVKQRGAKQRGRHPVSASFLSGSGIATALLAMMGPGAVAQVHAQPSIELEEVIVTARRREESLQRVPVSLTALDQQAIDAANAFRVRDLQDSVPNLFFPSIEYNLKPSIVLRGIESSSRNVGMESGVAVYVDGVLMGSEIAFNQELVEVERIEVLRGPQGTLFGRNSISGAINITSTKPSDVLNASVGLEYGDFDHFRAKGAISGPLVPGKLSAGVSGYRYSRDGIVKNLATGEYVDTEDSYGGRAQLRATPNEQLDITLAVDALREDNTVPAPQIFAGAGAYPGKFVTNVDQKTTAFRSVKGVSLTAEYELPSQHRIISVTSYREADRESFADADFLPLRANVSRLNIGQRQFSEELRWNSPAGGKVEYVLGLFHFSQKAISDTDISSLDQFPVPVLANLTIDIDGTIEGQSNAAFGNLDWHFTDAFTLNLGLRYTADDRELNFSQTPQGFLALIYPTLPPVDDERSESEWSPTVGLQYQMNAGAMFYAKAAQGYKSGGWNAEFVSNRSVLDYSRLAFDPESVWSYETGFKIDALERRLRLNGALFYMDYRDMQVTQFISALEGTRVSNAGKGTSKGMELELTALPMQGLSLSLGVGYADARVDEYKNALPGVDFDGHRLQNSPKWKGNFAASYSHPIGQQATLFARADYTYVSEYYGDIGNDPTGIIPSYSLMNGRVGVRFADDRWEVALWGRNVLDEYYKIAGRDVRNPATTQPQTIVTYGRPRIWGVSISARL